MMTQLRLVIVQLAYNFVKCSNPYQRRSTEQSVQNEDLANDMQYVLQTLTGMEERLAKLEESTRNQGKGKLLTLNYRIFLLIIDQRTHMV